MRAKPAAASETPAAPPAQEQVHVRDWQHPHLLAWEREDEALLRGMVAACARHEALVDEATWIERELDRLWAAFQRERSMSPNYDQDRIAEQDKKLAGLRQRREAISRTLLQEFPWVGAGPQARMMCCTQLAEERERLRLARVEVAAEINAQRQRLLQADVELTSVTERLAGAQQRERALLNELDQVRASIRSSVTALGAARTEWTAAARAAEFPGRPSIELPKRVSRESYVLREPASLIVGVNATEADVVRRNAADELRVL